MLLSLSSPVLFLTSFLHAITTFTETAEWITWQSASTDLSVCNSQELIFCLVETLCLLNVSNKVWSGGMCRHTHNAHNETASLSVLGPRVHHLLLPSLTLTDFMCLLENRNIMLQLIYGKYHALHYSEENMLPIFYFISTVVNMCNFIFWKNLNFYPNLSPLKTCRPGPEPMPKNLAQLFSHPIPQTLDQWIFVWICEGYHLWNKSTGHELPKIEDQQCYSDLQFTWLEIRALARCNKWQVYLEVL